ncbi:MAG: hypothetical protein PVF53_23085, partial [Desulfobacterales bacterium]
GYPTKKFGLPIFLRFAQLLCELANLRLPSLIHTIPQFFPRFGEGTKIKTQKSVGLSWSNLQIRSKMAGYYIL